MRLIADIANSSLGALLDGTDATAPMSNGTDATGPSALCFARNNLPERCPGLVFARAFGPKSQRFTEIVKQVLRSQFLPPRPSPENPLFSRSCALFFHNFFLLHSR
jgi:hypothetical protein